MKVIITIDYEVDGDTPDESDVREVLLDRLPGVLLSEDAGKDDLWALLPRTTEIEVKP